MSDPRPETPATGSEPAGSQPPAQPAPPSAAAPEMPVWRAAAFLITGALLALGAGLGQGIVSTNLYQIAGDMGATTAETSWLIIAYIVPRACLPLMLIKIRAQYGLRRFVEIGVGAYVLSAFVSLWQDDIRSAMLSEFLSGSASATLTTLGFLYCLEPLAPAWRLRLGLPVTMTTLLTATYFSRVISPPLIDDGGLWRIHAFSLGLALLSLASVIVLKLKPVPHQKVITPLDFVSFVLIATGFSSLIIAAIMGPIYWWHDALWIGFLLILGVVALTVAVVIELARKTPIIDIRWLASPAMLHFTATLLIFRLILSEQSTGAPNLFRVLGLAPSQLVPLFAVICIASVLGGFANVAWLRPNRVPYFHLVALVLIATGAFIDSQSSILTRPQQMFVSQSLIAFAGILFLPPAMMAGLISALQKGPSYILSFIIVFISTQSIGGMLGSGLFNTVINHRQAFHYQVLLEQLTAGNAALNRQISALSGAVAQAVPSAADQRLQALSQIATDATNQAYAMAYDDAYFLTFLIAVFAGCALVLHLFRDWLMARIAAAKSSQSSATEVAK